MIDPSDINAVIYRTAFAAFTHDPDTAGPAAADVLQADIDWCLTPLRDATAAQQDRIRALLPAVITDPAADRRGFLLVVRALAEPEREPSAPEN